MGVGVPDGVKEDEHGTDVVFGAEGEEVLEAASEAGAVLLPEKVMEEDAEGVHAGGFGEGELSVVEGGVPGGGLEHLQLVNGVGGDVVGAQEPGLPGVPGVGLVFCPAWLLGLENGCGDEGECGDEPGELHTVWASLDLQEAG